MAGTHYGFAPEPTVSSRLSRSFLIRGVAESRMDERGLSAGGHASGSAAVLAWRFRCVERPLNHVVDVGGNSMVPPQPAHHLRKYRLQHLLTMTLDTP